MDINKTIERKRSEIAKLEAEIKALETAHKIMVAEFSQEVIIPSLIIDGVADGGSIAVWNNDDNKKDVQIIMPLGKEEDTDIEVKEVLRQFSQL